jgi:hypothetical protein
MGQGSDYYLKPSFDKGKKLLLMLIKAGISGKNKKIPY